MKKLLSLIIILSVLLSCTNNQKKTLSKKEDCSYLDYSGKEDVLSGGVKMIPIKTEKGIFKVWTKRVGNNPDKKVLLLHGGPGATHEYFECFDAYFPKAQIEYYYYDQLESAYSDQPGDSSLWTVERYVDEVEQVRKALGLDSTNFFLLGHSWGGILAMEYALKYPQNLKGVIISNMMASIPEYIKYANEVLAKQMNQAILKQIKELEAQGKYTDKEYISLVEKYYYPEHVLHMPAEKWPEPVVRSFSKINYALYLKMQGPSEFGVVGNARLKYWDVSKELQKINIPALCIGGTYDTMDPDYMKRMASRMPQGEYLHCPNGAHMAMYDDQKTYFEGLIRFINKVDKQKKIF